MANLSDLKSSLTELLEPERIALINASRKRRSEFTKKPDKKTNKILINKLSQEQKLELLKMLKGR